ncbi:MAG: hypothetical protein AAFS12_10815 [Cyanobacteria bacterium J06632_19]
MLPLKRQVMSGFVLALCSSSNPGNKSNQHLPITRNQQQSSHEYVEQSTDSSAA